MTRLARVSDDTLRYPASTGWGQAILFGVLCPREVWGEQSKDRTLGWGSRPWMCHLPFHSGLLCETGVLGEPRRGHMGNDRGAIGGFSSFPSRRNPRLSRPAVLVPVVVW